MYEPNTVKNRIRLSEAFASLQNAQTIILLENVSLTNIQTALNEIRKANQILQAIEQNMVNQGEPKIGG